MCIWIPPVSYDDSWTIGLPCDGVILRMALLLAGLNTFFLCHYPRNKSSYGTLLRKYLSYVQDLKKFKEMWNNNLIFYTLRSIENENVLLYPIYLQIHGAPICCWDYRHWHLSYWWTYKWLWHQISTLWNQCLYNSTYSPLKPGLKGLNVLFTF